MPCSSSVLSCRARRRPRSWACRAPPSSSCSRSRPRPRSSTRRSGAYGPERSRSRRRKRTGAVVEATGDLQWLEWSLPDEDDLDDFDAVKRANPAPWIGLASHAAHTIAKHSRRGWRIDKGRGSLSDEFVVRPVMDQFAMNLERLVPNDPDEDGWAVIDPVVLGALPDGYEWTHAATVLSDGVLYVAGGALNRSRRTAAVMTRRLDEVTVRHVLNEIDSSGRNVATWTFEADDLSLVVAEQLRHQGRPT